jgi:hypothetical protein
MQFPLLVQALARPPAPVAQGVPASAQPFLNLSRVVVGASGPAER